ncbi:hypothetical protein FGO68_gene384 [Halteria grandinella]|uniref:RRM domain-containing protein n=1 Tax=Halteria grandinella TaxID=5974 RepID=A0A8J8T1F3_HALGN|nr:hypothetical protein FGO68_gene384 [Halteria grandinella]
MNPESHDHQKHPPSIFLRTKKDDPYNLLLPPSVTSLGIKSRPPTSQEAALFRISPERILSDKRTSLMIKNIPNKYTQRTLKETLEESHKQAFDFLYLPIDFKNGCNVGYAFINMRNAEAVLTFYRKYNGQRWGMFNSEKVCEITYARLQGFKAMHRHFQTSTIKKLEDAKMKPVIIR